jgi:hypothetical protein
VEGLAEELDGAPGNMCCCGKVAGGRAGAVSLRALDFAMVLWEISDAEGQIWAEGSGRRAGGVTSMVVTVSRSAPAVAGRPMWPTWKEKREEVRETVRTARAGGAGRVSADRQVGDGRIRRERVEWLTICAKPHLRRRLRGLIGVGGPQSPQSGAHLAVIKQRRVERSRRCPREQARDAAHGHRGESRAGEGGDARAAAVRRRAMRAGEGDRRR